MWLINDYTGPASKTMYGKKGDEVAFIHARGSNMYLVKNGGQLFYIRKECLSTTFIEKEKSISQTQKIKSRWKM